jgi:osmotically inducible protein OsmC
MAIRTAHADWHGAAHAGCFSMALAHELSQAGYTVDSIKTTAHVHFNQDKARGWSIPLIELATEGNVPGITLALFSEHAQRAKENCPVSRALASVVIGLTTTLVTTRA